MKILRIFLVVLVAVFYLAIVYGRNVEADAVEHQTNGPEQTDGFSDREKLDMLGEALESEALVGGRHVVVDHYVNLGDRALDLVTPHRDRFVADAIASAVCKREMKGKWKVRVYFRDTLLSECQMK